MTRNPFALALAAALVALSLHSAPAAARAGALVAEIDLSSQRMSVYRDGALAHVWKVSTGRKGFTTPTGSYGPTRMHKMWYSQKYDNAPMPHAVFFRGGYAVHATSEVKRLGRPASHGCVRLHPDHARTFFNLVRATGAGSTRIVIRR